MMRREQPFLVGGAGLGAEAQVETATGWRRAADLVAGDLVHVHGGGLRSVQAVQHEDGAGAPLLHVPGGALGNCADLWLGAAQFVLIDTLLDPGLPDAMEVLVPAEALDGLRGMALQTAPAGMVLVTLHFEAEEVIWAQTGVMVHAPCLRAPETIWFSRDFPQLFGSDARHFLLRRLALSA
ncbi:MAG TPA: Hint domain-containing protein [Gemmobacter sp.]|nr:Hint domain-containing protein [Gemmobacter sp.]